MDRIQVKSLGVAAPGYGNALFLDEGDEVRANAVVFAPLNGAWTVYATDGDAAPIEETRRSFDRQPEAFDHMAQCLRDRVSVRQVPHPRPSSSPTRPTTAQQWRQLLESYRELGVGGALMGLSSLATALGWLWMSPVTYTFADARKVGVSRDEVGTYVFDDAGTGLVVVAACYSLAVLHMALLWRRGRHADGDGLRRSLRTAGGTALFATVALGCLLWRADEVEPALYYLPPVLALLSALAVAFALAARRARTA
ncbi:hypothetical protein [Nocardioides lijunqiniae]|uniref:hypothetical protein n=1 Tax=Nocardioides lijunqiniae TaxID=2760832 RepID=UPI00187814E6|nr:hypothetical protein [Nocardioides lijunqiniae]